jgi:hypothetical protein
VTAARRGAHRALPVSCQLSAPWHAAAMRPGPPLGVAGPPRRLSQPRGGAGDARLLALSALLNAVKSTPDGARSAMEPPAAARVARRAGDRRRTRIVFWELNRQQVTLAHHTGFDASLAGSAGGAGAAGACWFWLSSRMRAMRAWSSLSDTELERSIAAVALVGGSAGAGGSGSALGVGAAAAAGAVPGRAAAPAGSAVALAAIERMRSRSASRFCREPAGAAGPAGGAAAGAGASAAAEGGCANPLANAALVLRPAACAACATAGA